MMRNHKFELFFSVATVLFFILCDWLLRAESSPLQHYLLYNVDLRNLWALVNLGPVIAGLMLSGNVHQPSEVGYFLAATTQWFIVGYVISWVLHGVAVRLRDAA